MVSQAFMRRSFRTEDIDERERVWVGNRPVPVALKQGGRFRLAGEMTDTAMALLRTGKMLPGQADEDTGEAALKSVGVVKIVKDFQRNQLLGVLNSAGEILVGPVTSNPDGTIMARIGFWMAPERVMIVPVRKGLSCFGFLPP